MRHPLVSHRALADAAWKCLHWEYEKTHTNTYIIKSTRIYLGTRYGFPSFSDKILFLPFTNRSPHFLNVCAISLIIFNCLLGFRGEVLLVQWKREFVMLINTGISFPLLIKVNELPAGGSWCFHVNTGCVFMYTVCCVMRSLWECSGQSKANVRQSISQYRID